MANGGEVIFKFLGDDKELKKTMGDLGKIGKTALKGMLARNYGSSSWFWRYRNGIS